MLRLAVIIASTREGRFADYPAHWLAARLGQLEGVEFDTIDLRDFVVPYFDGLPPAGFPRQYASESVAELGARIDAADGFIVLTPEYNHGYPAVLKSALDAFYVEWSRKPIGFVSWGGVGGARAIEQLRLVAVELDMAPLKQSINILPEVVRPVRMATDPYDVNLFAPLNERLARFLSDLVWWAEALKVARA